jgi:hypothetical protein
MVTLMALALIAIRPSTTASAQGRRAAEISAEPLLGTWVNADPATRGIVKLVLAPSAGGGVSVAGFGACHPRPCVWTVAPAVVYAPTVKSATAVGFTAQIKNKFGTDILAAHLQGQNLEVELFTEFTDGSGRSNRIAVSKMTR